MKAVAEDRAQAANVTSIVGAIASRERSRAELQEANRRLVRAVHAAQASQVAAEEALEQQTHFMAVLAHEMRNPLVPIRTAGLLLERLGPDAKLLNKVQTMIERQVLHLSRLVDDLLDLSRVKTGKLRLESCVVNMRGVIDAAVDECSPAIEARQQRLNVIMPVRELKIHGDPVRLTQIISNLLDNASKYSPVGAEIGLSTSVVGDALQIVVTDAGIGITPQTLPHVFEAFTQDTKAINFNGAGLGLGLAIVQELVAGHGGTVIARSAGSGCGSQFVVTLPLSSGPKAIAG